MNRFSIQTPTAHYLATTFCYGCNIGPSQLAKSLAAFVYKRSLTPLLHEGEVDNLGALVWFSSVLGIPLA
jgi:hypothetical protein